MATALETVNGCVVSSPQPATACPALPCTQPTEGWACFHQAPETVGLPCPHTEALKAPWPADGQGCKGRADESPKNPKSSAAFWPEMPHSLPLSDPSYLYLVQPLGWAALGQRFLRDPEVQMAVSLVVFFFGFFFGGGVAMQCPRPTKSQILGEEPKDLHF